MRCATEDAVSGYFMVVVQLLQPLLGEVWLVDNSTKVMLTIQELLQLVMR